MKSLKKLLKLSRTQWISVAVLASSLGLAVAMTAIPHFTTGTPISSTQMNTNFDNVVAAVTTLETKVNALPLTIVASGSATNANFGTATAICPAGYRATGGGVDPANVFTMQITTSGPRISGTRLLLLADGTNTGLPDSWFGGVVNNSGATATFKVAVICSLV
jgi:hypothetical protein